MTDEIRIEYVNFKEVKKWPRNPKDHDLEGIKKSFTRFGFIKPILLDEGTGQLVAGHGRLETLDSIRSNKGEVPKGIKVVDGEWLLPVLKGVEFNNPAEAEAFLIADNRLSEIGGWDNDLLAEMLSEIIDVDGALEGIGFNIAEASYLVEGHELDLDAEVGASESKGYREYSALLTPEEYRFVIDVLVDLEKTKLSEDEYAHVNRKGYCLYKIVKEWSEVQGIDGVRERS